MDSVVVLLLEVELLIWEDKELARNFLNDINSIGG